MVEIEHHKVARVASDRLGLFAPQLAFLAPYGILLNDEQGSIVSLNRAMEEMFSVSLSTALGKPLEALFSAPSSQLLRAAQGQLRQGDNTSWNTSSDGLELTGRRDDNSQFPTHVTSQLLTVNDVNVMASFVRDISDQKAIEREIRRQNSRLSATIDYSPVGISMINSDFEILAVNPAFASMLGYDVNEIVGHKFAEFTHPDDIETTEDAAQSSFLNQVTHYTISKRYIHKKGHVVHAALSIGLIQDRLGNPEYAIANIQDLTQGLAAEAQLKEQQNQLNHLERLSVLGEMSAGIAHEIDQPLTAISIYAETAKSLITAQEPRSERAVSALESLHQEATRAGAVVERIRQLSRQVPVERTPVDCSKLIEEIFQLVKSDAQTSGIFIRVDLSRQLPKVLGDSIQLQQVILNLTRNAIDAYRELQELARKEIVIRTAVTEDEEILIEVTDGGIGISDDVANDMFRPFATTKKTGMGLGLSISQSIVSAHGGKLAHRNNTAGGSTFYFTLPSLQEVPSNV